MNLRATAKRARNLRQCLFQLNDSKIIRDVIFPRPPTPPAPRARRGPRRRARRNHLTQLLAPRTAPSRVARASSPDETIPGTGAISNSNVAPHRSRVPHRARARPSTPSRARARREYFSSRTVGRFHRAKARRAGEATCSRRRAWSNDARAGLAVALSADARKITRASAETHLRYFERHHRYL